MSKVAVVYWSGTGNTETMANSVVSGVQSAGGEAELILASDFSSDQLASYDAVAFGCPAMGAEVLEEGEFEPMFASVEGALGGKKIGLFGSYGWGDGQWMRDWEERVNGVGANLVMDGVMANNAPDEAVLAECEGLGAALV